MEASYYQLNKDRINSQRNKKEVCDICGVTYSHAHRARHITSRVHKQKLELKESKEREIELLAKLDKLKHVS